MKDDARKEVFELHQFFERWYRGECSKSDQPFSRFRDVIHRNFTYVFPDGTTTQKEPLVEQLWDMHGIHDEPGNDFRIEIENFRLLWHSKPWVLVLYRELQMEGKHTDGRISTALLRRQESAPEDFVWLHVHETRLSN